MKKTKQQKGFTLIEVLIAITIFVIFVTAMSSTYLYIARSQREANGVREMYSELRYIMTIITDEVKAKTIDYACYGTGLAGTSSNECLKVRNTLDNSEYLALIDRSGINRTIFKVETEGEGEEETNVIKVYKETRSLNKNGLENWVSDEKYMTYQSIPLRSIDLRNFEFEIAPLADPFDPDNVVCSPIQFQPSVSIYASVVGKAVGTETSHLDLQTTVSSRVYNMQTS